MDYADWMRNVRHLVRSRHPGIDPDSLDETACQIAFQAGVAPIFFVTQGPLPLRPPPAPIPVAPAVAVQRVATQPRRYMRVLGVLLAVLGLVAVGAWWSQRNRSGNDSFIPPNTVTGPRVLSVTATSTEEKASYSDTTWVHVNWFRIVSPDRIESKEDGPWTPFVSPPPGSRPIALAACRTMEKASYSTTTWVKVHLVLLTKDGAIWESLDGAPFSPVFQPDGKDVVGIAAASSAEKASYSTTTWWKIHLFRLLVDGSIESSDDGGPWVPLIPGDGKRVKAISATSSREKAAYSSTTWWSVQLFRLLDDGTVQVSESGGPWSRHSSQANASSIAAYTVETKAAYSSTTWGDIRVDCFSDRP